MSYLRSVLFVSVLLGTAAGAGLLARAQNQPEEEAVRYRTLDRMIHQFAASLQR